MWPSPVYGTSLEN